MFLYFSISSFKTGVPLFAIIEICDLEANRRELQYATANLLLLVEYVKKICLLNEKCAILVKSSLCISSVFLGLIEYMILVLV